MPNMVSAFLPAFFTTTYISVSFLLSLAALNLAPPRRTFLLFLIFAFAISAFKRLKTVSFTPECGQILGLFVLIWLAHISNVLCIEEYVITSKKGCIIPAYKMLFNARWIKTSIPAPDVRHSARLIEAASNGRVEIDKVAGDKLSWTHSDHLEHHPCQNSQIKPTRLLQRHKFLLSRVFSLLVICAAYRIYYNQLAYPAFFKPLSYSDFSPQKQVFFRRLSTGTITSREIFIRAWTVFHFVFSNWAVMTGVHDILSILFVVVLRVDDPDDWLPLFGSITNAYSLHNFWGGFWHSLVYRGYTSWAKYLLQKVFGTRMKSHYTLGKVMINFLVFFFSGMTHALVSKQLGHRCGVWEEVIWFCVCFLAMVVEETVKYGARSFLVEKVDTKSLRLVWKTFGYFWVFTFFFWSLPKVHYVRHYCGGPRW